MRPAVTALVSVVEEFFWRRRDILKKPMKGILDHILISINLLIN